MKVTFPKRSDTVDQICKKENLIESHKRNQFSDWFSGMALLKLQDV